MGTRRKKGTGAPSGGGEGLPPTGEAAVKPSLSEKGLSYETGKEVNVNPANAGLRGAGCIPGALSSGQKQGAALWQKDRVEDVLEGRNWRRGGLQGGSDEDPGVRGRGPSRARAVRTQSRGETESDGLCTDTLRAAGGSGTRRGGRRGCGSPPRSPSGTLTWAWAVCSSRPARSLATASSSSCSRSPATSASRPRTRDPKASFALVSSCSSSCTRRAERRSGEGGGGEAWGAGRGGGGWGAGSPGHREAGPPCCSTPCSAGWLWTRPHSGPQTRSPVQPAGKGHLPVAASSRWPQPLAPAAPPPHIPATLGWRGRHVGRLLWKTAWRLLKRLHDNSTPRHVPTRTGNVDLCKTA